MGIKAFEGATQTLTCLLFELGPKLRDARLDRKNKWTNGIGWILLDHHMPTYVSNVWKRIGEAWNCISTRAWQPWICNSHLCLNLVFKGFQEIKWLTLIGMDIVLLGTYGELRTTKPWKPLKLLMSSHLINGNYPNLVCLTIRKYALQ